MKKHYIGLILTILIAVAVLSLFSHKKDATTNNNDYFISYESNYDKNKIIYVIGHMSPDSDTVCSAIAYANFLSSFGYSSKPAIAGKANAETTYILEKFGVEMPEIIDDANDKQFVLVDHSVYSQSIKNMKNASVLAIIDHHALGDIDAANPILYLGMPVGSTASIIYGQYIQNKISIDKKIAGIMISAILSDTLGLKSSTTTEYDRKAVKKLMPIAGINDYSSYTAEILEAGNEYVSLTIEEILKYDYKKYTVGNTNFSIGLVQSTNEKQLEEIKAQLDTYMETEFQSLEEDMCFVMIVNIVELETQLLCYGENALKTAQKAFDIESENIILKNAVSRKKQVVPYLTKALEQSTE